MSRPLALLAALALLAGCSGATYDEAYGRPDARRWTYFEASPGSVISSIEAFYATSDVRLESSEESDGGVVLTLASRYGGAATQQILVQATAVEGFTSRAQLFPRRRPLPRDLEQYVSGRR